MTTPPKIKTTNLTTKEAFRLFARWLDDRHDAHVKLADEYHDEPTESAEQRSVASAFRNTANVAWEIAGGRPDETTRDTERYIKVSTTDLAALLGTLTNEPSSTAAEPEGWTGDVPFAMAEPTTEPCEFGEKLPTDEELAKLVCSLMANTWLVAEETAEEIPDVQKTLVGVPRIREIGSDSYRTYIGTMLFVVGGTTVRQIVAPILAAKNARIAILEQDQEEKLVAARRYIADLERRGPINECSNAERTQHEATIERQRLALLDRDVTIEQQTVRIAKLEKRLAAQTDSLNWYKAEHNAAAIELGCSGMTLEEAVRATVKKLELPIGTNGETPGEVYTNAFRVALDARTEVLHGHAGNTGQAKPWRDMSSDRQAASNEAADAVLRAFGPQMVRTALERVREALLVFLDSVRVDVSIDNSVSNIIDAEIAKCGATVPTTATPTPHGRIFLGVTFERELPDGTRERIDPQDIRFYAGDELLPLVPVVNESKSPPID